MAQQEEINMKKVVPVALIAAVVLVFIFFGSSMIFKIEPGEKAVTFRPMSSGLDKENVTGEGYTIIAPWNDLLVYRVKEQTKDETMDVLDKKGLSITVDITVRFNPKHNEIGYLHENFGKNYVNLLVIPEVRAAVRKVTGRYTAEEVYSTKRKLVEDGIIEEAANALGKNFIHMKALLIRSIRLPDEIKNAIESKLTQEQETLAYEFMLVKASKEAERQKIEAEGKATANRIISASLTDKILREKGINATIKLSESNNSKVVVIGSGKNGMPLILGNN